MSYVPNPLAPTGMPKLRVELVPSTCWPSNVRSWMRDPVWRKLAKEVAQDNGQRCIVCGGRGQRHAVECHEAWHYDEQRHVQTLMRLDALCPACHSIKHLGRTLARGREDMARYWLAKINEWDTPTTQRYIDAVFEQWRARSNIEWTLDLSVLGAAYEVDLETLNVDSYVLSPREREQMQHRRTLRAEDPDQRNGTTIPRRPKNATRKAKGKAKGIKKRKASRPTRTAARRSTFPLSIDWEQIARSGVVWEFIQGEDFNGNASNFRKRAKTAARKNGVDFDSVETHRTGKAVLKILAYMINDEPQPQTATPTPTTGATDASPSGPAVSTQLRLFP